jgi:two-component system sensor histidine kinase BaeS
MKGLYKRIALTLIGITSGILLIASIIFILETHHHFLMYQHQSMDLNMDAARLDKHFEEALVQSIIWISISGLLIAIFVSLYVAKRITSPLLEMKKTAERMAMGELNSRTNVGGNDELSDLAESLNHLASQLQTQEQLRITMTTDVAHELRTPLSTLKSHMEAMILGIWEPTQQRLESCYEEIDRLNLHVGDLEQLTEMESPRFRLQLKEEELTAIAKQNVDAATASFNQKGVRLEISTNTNVTARVDRQRVSQIIVNLLSNALKFTPTGGLVTVQVIDESKTVAIIVRDTGIGMNENEYEFIFERFYRVEKSRNRNSGGSGIGLAIVKKLVESHHGQIVVQSIEKQGTLFKITLPK